MITEIAPQPRPLPNASHRLVVQRSFQNATVEQAGEVSAHQCPSHLLRGNSVHRKQFGEREAVGELVENRRLAATGDRGQEGARRQRCALGAECRRAVALQVGQIGQRLDIAHQRGSIIDARFEWAGRLVRWLGRAAVDHPNRGGLLAGHVPGRDGQHVNRDALGVGIELAERGFDTVRRFRIGHIHVGAVSVDDRRGQPQSVQDQVGAVAQQPAVLDRSRFSLFAIRDDDGATGVCYQAPVVAHGTQLHRERKGRTTPADESAGFDFTQQCIGAGERAVPAEPPIGREVLPGLAGLLSQQPRCAPGQGGGGDGRGLGGVHGRPAIVLVRLAHMRTAVVRVNVDPESVLTPAQLGDGMAALLDLAAQAGAGVVENDLASMPVTRREVELLIAAEDGDTAKEAAIRLCTKCSAITPSRG